MRAQIISIIAFITLFLFLLIVATSIAQADLCQGGRFKPCTCWRDAPRAVHYRPKLNQCKGNAAVILSGKYKNSFSVVVRDIENRDRWPLAGLPGCGSDDVLAGLSKCSAFKTQRVIKGPVLNVYCLGASGNSDLFKQVTRITIKLRDLPGSNMDPLARICLASPNLPLN